MIQSSCQAAILEKKRIYDSCYFLKIDIPKNCMISETYHHRFR